MAEFVRTYPLSKGDKFTVDGIKYRMISDLEWTKCEGFEFYTDGSALKSGEGGWGMVVTLDSDLYHFDSGRENLTTNNRMELTAILKALTYIDYFNIEEAVIYSDSAYCVNALNEWIFNWAKRDWVKADGKPVENQDLMEQLYWFIRRPFYLTKVKIKKIKGHSGILGNELADALATKDIKNIVKLMKQY